MNQNPRPVRSMNIELKPEQAEGTYSNFVLIGHAPSEFILDFARILHGQPKARVMSRILMTPENVVKLKKTLEQNIKKFEERYGKIELKEKPGEAKEMGFAPPEQS
ncbi:DUF3467 domain-containing protein [candidate division WOR-3 bacterium]|uniref:DUF3467 domain-containing protein n=1 Tax=candidate division WOR-3 bacterium TaxID=2052148 RepID=A0A9D5KAH5_UNCW3|nr:DUF3467 domain-containing protein [candidate division WOR-3 bacterium]MBD3365386.1 DUF3467 domain-containing protein [candidate division WOR-3 bacterium]